MATHIDVLVGDYRSGVDSNLKALQSDYRCINFGGGEMRVHLRWLHISQLSHDGLQRDARLHGGRCDESSVHG